MPNAIKEVKFNDGEGLDIVDFHNLQRFSRALLLDGIMGGLARRFEQLVLAEALPTDVLFAVGGGGMPGTGPGALTVGSARGLVLQRVSANEPDGSDYNLLAYYLDAAELQSTLGAADPANDRIDLISVKLEQEDAVDTSRDYEDANVIGSGNAVEETVAVAANVGVLAQKAISILGIYASVGGVTGLVNIIPAAGTLATKLAKLAADRKTLTFFGADAVTEVKVIYIPATNVAHYKTTTAAGTNKKQRRVKLTKTVTPGTPNLNPVPPATPAGHVRWCCVRVPAAHAAGLDQINHIYDMRVPLGVKTVVVAAHQAKIHTGFTLSNDGAVLTSANNGDLAYIEVPYPWRYGRLLKVEWLANVATIDVIRRDVDNAYNVTETVVKASANPFDYTTVPPIWGQGYPTQIEQGNGAPTTSLLLKLTAGAGAQKFHQARLTFAGTW